MPLPQDTVSGHESLIGGNPKIRSMTEDALSITTFESFLVIGLAILGFRKNWVAMRVNKMHPAFSCWQFLFSCLSHFFFHFVSYNDRLMREVTKISFRKSIF